MKTTIRVIMAAAMINFLCTCCESPEIPDAKINGLTTEIVGEVFIDKFSEELLNDEKCENIQDCLIGTGNSNAEALSEISLECFYDLTVLGAESPEHIQLSDGNFKLYTDGINEIYGTFRGCGGNCNDVFSVELLFEVTGGNGLYQDARGYIKGKIVRFPQYPKILHLEINGIVNHSFTGY